MNKTHVSRLITSKDLNHHGTLFAGRTAMWMIEACFVSAAKTNKRTDNIVCVNIEGFNFKKPVMNGDVIDIVTFPVYAGRSSLTILGNIYCISDEGESILETAVTFVTLDPDGKPCEHGIVIDRPEDPDGQKYWDRFDKLRTKRNR